MSEPFYGEQNHWHVVPCSPSRRVYSLCAGFALSVILFIAGFFSAVSQEAPRLVKTHQGIRLTEYVPPDTQQKPELQQSVTRQTVPKVSMQAQTAPDVPTPPLAVQFAINPALQVGLAVPSPPVLVASSVPESVFSAGELDDQPRLTHAPAPLYPPQAKNRGLEAEILVRMVIDAQGRVVRANIVSQKHTDVFGQTTLDAVKKWRFKPGKKAHQAVLCEVEVPVSFSLER